MKLWLPPVGLRFILVCVLWGAFDAAPMSAAVEQTLVTAFGSSSSTPDGINSFELYNTGLWWTEGNGGCSVEFHSNSKIGISGTYGGTPRAIVSDCALGFGGVTRSNIMDFFLINFSYSWIQTKCCGTESCGARRRRPETRSPDSE